MSDALSKIRNILKEDLENLDILIQDNICGTNVLLRSVITHIQKIGGKRIRVLLAMLISKMYGKVDISIIKIVAAIEFIHNATLLHDDVMDCNTNRRGLSSANELWNNKVCILSGDFLLSQAFALIASVDNVKVSMLFAKTSSILIEGEINQLIYNDATNEILDFGKYLSVIEAKTASLFSLSTTVGAIFIGVSDKEVEALGTFGHYLGIAFQIIDDLLDYLGTEEELGKPIGLDYKEKKVTLPLILLRKTLLDDDLEALWLNEIWNVEYSEERLNIVIDYMKNYNIRKLSEKYVEEYVSMARSSLNCVKRFSQFYELLIELSNFVINRNV